MGSKLRRREVFLSKNCICCFCGGESSSEEIDHIPSRVLFDNRQWPEGYEFPACKKCNRTSRHDEQVIAMLSRMTFNPDTEKGKKEVFERIRAVAHNYPKVLIEMEPTDAQVIKGSKKYKLGMTLSDNQLLSVKGPLVNGAVHNFGRKLSLALYYKHANKVLPPSGGILVRWYSNLQIENDEIPKELAPFLSGIPKLERCRTGLDGQFFYRYGLTDTKDSTAFLIFLEKLSQFLVSFSMMQADLIFQRGSNYFDHILGKTQINQKGLTR